MVKFKATDSRICEMWPYAKSIDVEIVSGIDLGVMSAHIECTKC